MVIGKCNCSHLRAWGLDGTTVGGGGPWDQRRRLATDHISITSTTATRTRYHGISRSIAGQPYIVRIQQTRSRMCSSSAVWGSRPGRVGVPYFSHGVDRLLPNP